MAQLSPETVLAAGDSWPQFMHIICILIITGGFGGMISALSTIPITRILEEGKSAYGNRRRLAWVLAMGALYGIGSGIAAGLVLYCDGRFDNGTSANLKTLLLLASTGVIAGFSGIRMLRLMSGKLEQKVNNLSEKVETGNENLHNLSEKVETENETLKKELSEQGVKSQLLVEALS